MRLTGIIRRGFNYAEKLIGKKSKVAEQVLQPQKPIRMTKTLTDASTGVVRMEREITRNGKEAMAKIEVFPNGERKLTIEGGADNPLWRTTTITREKGASVFGGDKVVVNKHTTKYWCYGENSNLTKEFNPEGILEHKELRFGHSSGNGLNDYSHVAVQDRVYNEYPLNHSVSDMLKNPSESKYIQHSLDGENNYYNFATKGTRYTRAVEAKKQAAVDAAKKAEAEAIAAKEAAEKAAAELRAKRPRINTGKALGKNIEDLKVKETKLADGTIERVFTDPDTGKVLAKTHDLGILHKEWIFGGKADMIYMKQVGKEHPYIISKKGNYTQTSYTTKLNTSNGKRDIANDYQYYNTASASIRRTSSSLMPLNDATGYIEVYDKTAPQIRKEFPSFADKVADYPRIGVYDGVTTSCFSTNAQKQANVTVKNLNKDANLNYVDLRDLYRDYKA